MMDKFRNQKLDVFTDKINLLIQAIAAKENTNLNIMEIFRQDDVESLDKATYMAMQENAREALVLIAALATSHDRIVKMVEQMADEMSADGNENCHRYRTRLAVLTNFQAIVKELTPPEYEISTRNLE